jgi:hypothetical protein
MREHVCVYYKEDTMSEDKKVPTVPGKNAFEAYADDVDTQRILGTLLRFTKGDWLVGRDGDECPESELVAIMPGFTSGWIRWENNCPVGHAMGLLIEGFVSPKRDELGHQDNTQWGLDGKGEPRDPWQEGLYLPMVTVEGETVYTFTSTSDGARRRGAGPLCREYGHHIRQHPDELPIVGLKQDSYVHSDRSIGRVKYPLFPIDRWVKAEPYIATIAAITGRPMPLLPKST